MESTNVCFILFLRKGIGECTNSGQKSTFFHGAGVLGTQCVPFFCVGGKWVFFVQRGLKT